MKYTVLFLLLLGISLYAQRADEVEGVFLTLKVENISTNVGIMSVALCNSKENYEHGKEPFRGTRGEIKDGICMILFENVPPGEYAIKCFHDENGNGKLDTNFMGIPSEDYGFSNNASGSFGPASWEDAKFTVKENTVVTIDLE